MIMGTITTHMLGSVASFLMYLLFLFALARWVRRPKRKAETETEKQPPINNGEAVVFDEPSDGLGFEVPKMRRAPRVEQRKDNCPDGVFREVRHETAGTPVREHCIASEKDSSINEGRHSCAAGEAPSEFQGKRPTRSEESKVLEERKKGPLLTAVSLRDAVIVSEVLGKPKALRRNHN